jgi:release factor glutamine methyltransferase
LRHEERILLAHITGKTQTQILLNPNEPLPDDQNRAFLDALARREKGEPLQYIIGEWDFYGLTFKTDKRALIPRPETERLVEAVIKETKDTKKNILDICTGSGCIAITLAVLTPANITATDISPDALSLAKENAALLNVNNRIRFIRSDLADALTKSESQSFDIIVSNPPYIPTNELPFLQTEVYGYEPRMALDGGADGLEVYRRLLPQAYQLLKPGGLLFLEIGPLGVGELAVQNGFENVQILKDYAGLDRIVCTNKQNVL